MRGKQCKRPKNTENYRITPADAGKTMCGDCSDLAVGDHPRGCGENLNIFLKSAENLGSPPRMRGKQGYTVQRTHQYRITPADAGKTSGAGSCCCGCWDHPRGCGENAGGSGATPRTRGSPPRMRGKPVHSTEIHEHYRITPADAGKTEICRINKNLSEDHPRGCGENLRGCQRTKLSDGSPPRMRGKHNQWQQRLQYRGITPADAGKTRRPPHCGVSGGGITPADAGKTPTVVL